MKKDSFHYEKLSEQMEHLDKKALDKLKQNLRDSYLQLKDLSNRCLIDISNIEKNDKRIFYFKPESVLLQDPETQRLYREGFLKQISSAPSILRNHTVASELGKELNDVMQDLTEPDQVREMLAQFYQRRLYNLQHKKYKSLLRWAHFALTSEYLDRIGHHGTFTYGRLQYELENSIKRYERLSQDDDYGAMRDGERVRPRTKGTDEEVSQSMYNEKPRKDPLSCIRMDDFEIYIRAQAYEQKLFQTAEKFIARIKWLPMSKRFDLFKESHIHLKLEQEKLHSEQISIQRRIRQRFDNSNIRKSDDLIIQMEEILQVDYPASSLQPHQYYTKAPINITNLMELQLQIQERAAEFKIIGDIELDEGHSFTYQVNIFFTTYFQRQIIKSQFSLYDSTVRDMKDAYESNEAPDDETGDINEIQRRNLQSLMLIDFQMVDQFNSNQDQSNLFLLKKGKKINEQIPELKKNFQDIVVVRLKKAHWLSEVLLTPRVDENQRRQNLFFSFEYTPDLLLQSIQDFMDVNDISTVNTIYSDLTNVYVQVLQNQEKMMDDQLNQILGQSHLLVSDKNAKELLNHFKDALKLHLKENEHLTRQKQKDGENNNGLAGEKKTLLSRNSVLRLLPKHYIQSLYTLRHMKMRDTKTKLLYVLNFFRAVQKRLTLDLREFVGREIVPENVDSSAPQEATYTGKNSNIISGNINYSFKVGDDPKQRIQNENKKIDEMKKKQAKIEKQQQVTGGETIEEEDEDDGGYDKYNLLDLKKWKHNGQFHTLMLSTCPVIPQFHSAHGEPLQDRNQSQDFTDSKSTTKTHITKKSSSYLTRMDAYKIDEETREIYVVDDFGMNIMFDCALEDMVQLDKEILKIGTFFIRKNEQHFDFSSYKFPFVERFQLLEDLLQCEFDFYYQKARIVLTYLEAYEHICDPLEQQRMMQIITDIISMRPRIDYQGSYGQANYFIESYRAEVLCYETWHRLIREIVDQQMKLEKKENNNIRDYLHITYQIANQYVNKQWSDANPEDLKKEVKTRQVIQGGMRFQDLQEIQEQMKQDQKQDEGAETQPGNLEEGKEQQPKEEPQPAARESNVDKFAEILGLKGVSMETMMKQHSRTDEVAEEVMNQDANFIKTQEGYPILMRESNDSLSNVRFSPASNQIGVLDFYESLTVIPKIHSALNVIFKEVEDSCLPANQLQLIALQTVYFEKCYVEFKKCVAYAQDELTEYKGSQFIENDLIMSSPDKIMFLIKDMIAHLSRTYKKNLNPFFVSKLDYYTVHNFQFPDMLKEQMQSQLRLDVNFSRNFIETQLQSKGGQARFFPKLREDDRKVNVPPMLLVFCNLVEVMRLREQLITNLSESQVLGDFYLQLRDMVNRNNFKMLFQNPLVFETFTVSNDQINFVEDGSLTDVDIDLAVNEFDTNLRSNLNFMNTESFQCLVLDGGVAELRAATTYQVLQKQLLIVANRTNLHLMAPHLRAIAELELYQQHRIKLENSVIDYKTLHRLNGSVNEDLILTLRSKFMRNMNYELGEEFVQLLPIKQAARTIVEKKFKQTVNSLTAHKDLYQELSSLPVPLPSYSIARLMRDYKISLLFCFCSQVCRLNTIEATKFDLIQNNWDMKRALQRMPKEVAPLFNLQDNESKEALFQNMFYDKNSIFEEQPYFLNNETHEIQSIQTIPSSKTVLLHFGSYSTSEERRLMEEVTPFEKCQKQLEFSFESLKRNNIDNLDLKQKTRKLIIALIKTSQNDVRYISDQLTLGKIFRVQKTLLEIVEINFFFAKLQMHPLECLQMEIAAERILPFWSPQDTLLEDQLLTEVDDEGLGEKIMKKLIYEKKQKHQLSDEMEQMAKSVRGIFIKMVSDIVTCTLNESLDYLTKVLQSLNYKVTAGLLNVLNSFYLKGKSAQTLKDLHYGLREITRIDLIAPLFSNGTVLDYRNLDQEERNFHLQMKCDYEYFNRSIKGIKNENELVRGEFVLLQNLFNFYSPDHMHIKDRASNFCGQIATPQYKFLNSMILGLDREDVTYLSTEYNSIDQNIKELLELDKIVNEASMYSLQKRTNYLQDIIKSRILYFSMMILVSGKSLGLSATDFNNQLKLYKNEVNWKVENEFQKKLNKFSNKRSFQEAAGSKQAQDRKLMQRQGQRSEIDEERLQRAAISNLDYNIQQTISTQPYRTNPRDLQIQHIRQGNILQRATIKMGLREIERRLVRLGIDAISGQMSAICKCLEMTSKQIDNSGNTGYGGSMQNFAPTFFDYANKQSHLEVINRVSHMQLLLTKIRNRGMDIETLTSGPGIVFTYKDLNECLQQFCTDAISYSEKELKSRTHSFHQIINHQKHLIYIKDRRVEALKKKLKLVYDNITRIVNSRIYEKGNSLIFELDRALREKRFYQDHIFVFEQEMKEFVREEFRLMLQRKDLALDLQKKLMKDVGNQLVSEVKYHVLNEQKRIKKQIKTTARKMRDLDTFKSSLTKQRSIFQGAGRERGESGKGLNNESDFNIQADDINKLRDEVNMKDSEWVLSPEEATQEMLRMQMLLAKQRTFWMLKFQSQQTMFEDQIQVLKTKLTSNTALWDQLQEADKRTKILQQELTFTQKSLSQCEKIIEKLKEELKASEQERVRLFQYKQNKAQRLEELEQQVKKIDISEHINITKVIDMLSSKDKELNVLKKNEKHFEDRLNQQLSIAEKEKLKYKKKLLDEAGIKSQILNQMNNLRQELLGFETSGKAGLAYQADNDKGLDSKEEGGVLMWKNKCKELLEICQSLTDENQQLSRKLVNTISDAGLQTQQLSSKEITQTMQLIENSSNQGYSSGTYGVRSGSANATRVLKSKIAKQKVQNSGNGQVKSRNVAEKQGSTFDGNLFSGAGVGGESKMLPNIVVQQQAQTLNPNDSQAQADQMSQSFNNSLGGEIQHTKLTNMLNNSAVLGLHRLSDVTSFRGGGARSEFSDYANNNYALLTDHQNSQSSLTNILGNMPIKPIKPIMAAPIQSGYQLLLNGSSGRSQNLKQQIQSNKSKGLQRRNVSSNSYTTATNGPLSNNHGHNLSAYDPPGSASGNLANIGLLGIRGQGQYSTSMISGSGVSHLMSSSERNHQIQRNYQEYSLDRALKNQTERNKLADISQVNNYYNDQTNKYQTNR